MEIQSITYAQWLKHIKTVKDKGIRSDSMKVLCTNYPQVNMMEYQEFVYNEIAKLETVILTESIEKFQITVNKCISENDIEMLVHGFRCLKKDLDTCFFFNVMEKYPVEVKRKLSLQMSKNLQLFVKEFHRYTKRLEENGSDIFISDFEYICRKANLKKYVEELNIYV